MKIYKLSPENYKTLRRVSLLEEIRNSARLNDEECTIQTDNLRLLMILLNEEISTRGMTEDQQEVNAYGLELYALYDELLAQKESNETN